MLPPMSASPPSLPSLSGNELAVLALSALLLAAAFVDWKERRIPNQLVTVGALHAMVMQGLLPLGIHPAASMQAGTPGVLSGLLAGALMLLAAGTVWRLGLWGAGDAKWLTVTAAHAGPALVPLQLLSTAVAAALLALAWKAARKSGPMPYAVAIAAGQFGLMACLAWSHQASALP